MEHLQKYLKNNEVAPILFGLTLLIAGAILLFNLPQLAINIIWLTWSAVFGYVVGSLLTAFIILQVAKRYIRSTQETDKLAHYANQMLMANKSNNEFLKRSADLSLHNTLFMKEEARQIREEIAANFRLNEMIWDDSLGDEMRSEVIRNVSSQIRKDERQIRVIVDQIPFTKLNQN